MSDAAGRVHAFEGFRVDTVARQVRDADGHPLPLTAKAYEVLVHLIEHHDRVVGKDELLAHVWNGRVVEENNLNQAVSALRRAFGAGGGDHRYIVTVPGHGYRFVAELEEPVAEATPTDEPGVHAATRRRGWTVAALAAVAVLLATYLLWPRPARSPPAVPNAAALAVLPFRSVPAGSADEVLELGMAETLIARLSQGGALQVRSLDASMRLRGEVLDPVDAGRQLQVPYVLAGSAQRQGEHMRVTVRLLHVADGRTVWAGTFDERRDRVFSLQDTIAEAVASALAVKVATPRARRSPCDGDNAEAYRAYLSARHVMSRPTPQRLQEAEADLGKAIALDPACSRAHAARAQLHLEQISLAERDPVERYRLAWADVNRALALDPTLAEAHVARAEVELGYYWDAARAEASYKRALELDPGSAAAHAGYSDLLAYVGRGEESALHMWRTHELDPLSPTAMLGAASWLHAVDPVASKALLARALELEPGYWLALWTRAAWAREQGRMADAIADLEQAVRNSGRNSRVLSSLARAYVRSGDPARARAVLVELEQRQRRRYVHPSALAIVYFELGDDARAIDHLERAYAQHDMRIANLGEDPYWQRLYGNERFRALATKAALKPATTAARN